MSDFETMASGLKFPEGPVVMDDGSVIVCEIAAGRLTRIAPDGSAARIADTGGGPNGAAIGPDGRLYVCNNGGFTWFEQDGMLFTDGSPSSDYRGGAIQAVDPVSGAVETLYTHCRDERLNGPNDIVFDATGGFWFTDMGKVRARTLDRGGVYYAHPDGSHIIEAAFPLTTPNGIGLSPDGSVLYVSETGPARLWAFDLAGPGQIAPRPPPAPAGARFIAARADHAMFDSLAVEANGFVCVATLHQGGITVIDPAAGRIVETHATGDPMTTNIAFGGADRRTAFVTASISGRLLRRRWQRPGLALAKA